MASPMLVRSIDIKKLIITMLNVAIMFCFVDSFSPGFKNSSSRVSLQGRIVRGVAKRTTVRIPKREMKLGIMFG